jgi:hypothetical protein
MVIEADERRTKTGTPHKQADRMGVKVDHAGSLGLYLPSSGVYFLAGLSFVDLCDRAGHNYQQQCARQHVIMQPFSDR